MEDSGLVQFEPVESLLLTLLVEACPLGAARVDHRRSVDSVLLLPVKMPRGEELEVSGNRRLADVGLLSEVAFEALDWIVREEDVHRSEERRVGKECISWCWPYEWIKE